MTTDLQVLACLAKYALVGVAPMVIPSPLVDITIPTMQILRQQGTDLQHIRRLADMVGYVFYLDPGHSSPEEGPPFEVSVAELDRQVDECERPAQQDVVGLALVVGQRESGILL